METEFESFPFIFMTLLKLECIWYQRPTYRFLIQQLLCWRLWELNVVVTRVK